MTFPGAEILNLDGRFMSFIELSMVSKDLRFLFHKYEIILNDYCDFCLSHCSGVKVFCEKAWMIFSSSSNIELTSLS